MSEIIVFGTPESDYAVFDCLPKKDDRQWRIGDYALKYFPMRDVGRPPNNVNFEENLRKFAEAIGVEYETVLDYRDVSSAWKIPVRTGNTSFSIHKVLRAFPYLMRDDLTVNEARKLVKDEKARLEAEEKERAEAERIRLEEAEAQRQAAAEAEKIRIAEEAALQEAVSQKMREIEVARQAGEAAKAAEKGKNPTEKLNAPSEEEISQLYREKVLNQMQTDLAGTATRLLDMVKLFEGMTFKLAPEELAGIRKTLSRIDRYRGQIDTFLVEAQNIDAEFKEMQERY